MFVGLPALGANVNFHVAGARRLRAELQDRPMKIGTGFGVSKTGMKHRERLAVQCPQLVAPQALVLPDGLQQPLRRGRVAVAQPRRQAGLRAPAGIETVRELEHLAIAFARAGAQSQAFATSYANAGGNGRSSAGIRLDAVVD